MSLSDEPRSELKKLEASAQGMLPGVAGICMFMLVLTMLNAFAALSNAMGLERESMVCWHCARCWRRGYLDCCG